MKQTWCPMCGKFETDAEYRARHTLEGIAETSSKKYSTTAEPLFPMDHVEHTNC